LAGERAILAGHIAFDVGETAVEVAKARADVARRARRRGADALPELLVLAVVIFELARLGRGDPAGDEIDRDDRAAAQEQGRKHADPDERDVEAGIIGDPGADAHDLAVALVAIEAGAAGRLLAQLAAVAGIGLGIAIVAHHRSPLVSSRSASLPLPGRHCWRQSGFSTVMIRSIVHSRSSSRRAASWRSSSSLSSPSVRVFACFHLVT